MTICTKCQGLCAGAALCQRCSAVAELLDASTALHGKVSEQLERDRRRSLLVNRFDLMPLVERAGKAIVLAKASGCSGAA